jgi:hypothetical protein
MLRWIALKSIATVPGKQEKSFAASIPAAM